MLRATEASEAAGVPVVHLSTIAYQWRSHPGSVAKDPGTKSYSVEPAMRAVAEACQRRGHPLRYPASPVSSPTGSTSRSPTPRRPWRWCSFPPTATAPRAWPRWAAAPTRSYSCGCCTAPARPTHTHHRRGARRRVARLPGGLPRHRRRRPAGHPNGLGGGDGWAGPAARGRGGGRAHPARRRHGWGSRADRAGIGGRGPAMAGMPPTEDVYLAWPVSIHEVLAAPIDALLVDVAAAIAAGASRRPGLGWGSAASTPTCVYAWLRTVSARSTRLRRLRRAGAARRRQGGPGRAGGARPALGRAAGPRSHLNPGLARTPEFRVDSALTLPEVPPEVFTEWLQLHRTPRVVPQSRPHLPIQSPHVGADQGH